MSHVAITQTAVTGKECPYCKKVKLVLLNNQIISCNYCGRMFHYCGNQKLPVISDVPPYACCNCQKDRFALIVYEPRYTYMDYVLLSLNISKTVMKVGWMGLKSIWESINNTEMWSMMCDLVTSEHMLMSDLSPSIYY